MIPEGSAREFDAVLDRFEKLLGRAEVLLARVEALVAPLTTTQQVTTMVGAQVGEQLKKSATTATTVVGKAVQAGRGLTGR